MFDVNPSAFRAPLRIVSILTLAVELSACASLDHTPLGT
jgi:hypothetical protein